MSGPLRFPNVGLALIKLGGREFRKGELVDTGLDIPRGAFVPLGMKVTYSLGRLRMA